jgi:ubiquinone/menaquinone biosynthesis C-methylase UbiE
MNPSAVPTWQAQAARWIANADRTAALTAAVSDALLAALQPARGERVLDVACGVGDPALQIAARVGEHGAVLAADAVEPMLAALSERANARGLSNVATLHRRAESLDVPPGGFDAACSRFGVMFFDDAERALAGMRRAVRADGRLVVAAWSVAERNPFFTLAMTALDAAGAPPLDLPAGTRTVFEHAEPGLLAGTATRAGWRSVSTRSVRFEMRLPDCRPEHLIDVYEELSDKVVTRLSGCSAGQQEAARAALAASSRPYARGPDIALPAEALLVCGLA